MKNTLSTVLVVGAGFALGCSEITSPIIDTEEQSTPELTQIVRWPAVGGIRFTANGSVVSGAVVRRELASSMDTTVLYLADSVIPTGTLNSSMPTAWVMPNYDPSRTSWPGLLLAKSNDGLIAEQDQDKYHQFVAQGPFALSGQAQFTFWSAMSDFDTTMGGSVDVGLFECDTDATNCRTIALGSETADPWHTGAMGFSKYTIDFGMISDSIVASKALVLKIVVRDTSDDEMLFGYGTTFRPSKLIFGTGVSAEQPDEIEWSFFAVRGEERILELSYTDENGAAQDLPFFSLDASQPTRRPDGSAIVAGDSIRITVTVDTTEMIVYLEPTGLQFDSTLTPLKLWYGAAGEDLNGDGLIDSLDAEVENALGIWYQEDATQPWERLQTEKSTTERWLSVSLKHFSNYAVAW